MHRARTHGRNRTSTISTDPSSSSSEPTAYLAARALQDADGDQPPVGLGLQIRQHCLAFCESLHFHHSGEELMLSDLERRHPQLGEAITRLRAEHQTVDRIRGDLNRLLREVRTAEAERFRAELDSMSRELLAHLDYEEESLIPVLAQIPFPPGPPPGSGASAHH
jgi:hypothetical protein